MPGVDVSPWPLFKLDHAQDLGRRFNDDVTSYRSKLGSESVTELAEDGLSGVVRARLNEPAPIVAWAMALGDLLHNYRAALDGLAWQLAHLDGRAPHERYRSRIAFPIARSRTQWNRMLREELSGFAPFILERFNRVQPFYFLPVETGAHVMLHDLDILDKHRNALGIAFTAPDKVPYQWSVKFRDDGADFQTFMEMQEWEWVSPTDHLNDGDEIVRFTSPHAIEGLKIEQLPLQLRVPLHGTTYELFNLLNTIDHQVTVSFEVLLDGEPSSQSAEAYVRRGLRSGEWADVSNDSAG